MPKAPRKPFEISLSADALEDLGLELSRALDDALAVRSATEQDIKYWHTLYEQGRTRSAHAPWADAADLTSYLGTQYVDVLRSHIVKTVMVEPVFTVEGYGPAEAKAPFVEEFHQWQQEAMGFQQVFSRGVHLALIEPKGVLELYEDTIRRPVRKTIKALVQLAPDGTVLVDEKLQPLPHMGPDGNFAEVLDETQPFAEMAIDSYETVCRGPRARTIAYRNFLELPGHATDRSEVWGYAKRFYRRLDELKERATAGVYDTEAVEQLGGDDERASETTLAGEPIGVAAKDGDDRVEKELWEILFLRNLDKKGLRWFVATLSKEKRVVLRIQYDDIGRPRYFPLVPFPRPNSTEGYSYIGHKLLSVIEEHTAYRNALADNTELELSAPMMKLRTSPWDPDSEPFGPKAVITVNSLNEIQRMEIPDHTRAGVERLREVERAGERLSGINDAAAGVSSEEQRTLGEVQLITEQSLGRVSEAVKNIQETLEDMGQVMHLMWKRALAEMGTQGMEAPPSVLQGLEMRGQDITTAMPDKRFTAQMLEGHFRFKPRGSVENADRRVQQALFNQGLQALTGLMQVNPMIGMILATPQAATALLDQWARVHSVQNKQAFLGSQAMAVIQQFQAQQQAMQQFGPPPEGPDGQPPEQEPPPGGPQAV